ncbi:hypothetical protein HYC85_028971 [Camellia sinensis]|uniref:SUPPRESSOR-OF-WHITE-APRICOT-like C-terminal domain-containing protein n=1 Tax=Camellia sinensis TaxID=4442 RepID=A0A7J7FWL6_CAMSI|nr:hypothetical protein HYC85_028971 [Camellia sinensis]
MGMYVNAKSIKPSSMHKLNGCCLLLILLPLKAPYVGPKNGSDSKDDNDEYERDSPVRNGGACIPPPPNLQVDSETGTYADGSVEGKPGSSSSGRLGLGATPNPNEASQYYDVYSSYRKQRSSNYHTSMSARAATAR